MEESIAFVTITGKMSFREFRELLILLYGDNIVQMKSFFTFKTKSPEFPHENYEQFDLDSANSTEFVSRSKASLALSQHSDYFQC